mmetsp:Transcript_32230/g.48666  ORF Transcript_32230/g.48666 Transcript_32230/m.48666 type:complete len:96 (-) Transcript_32230:109-396(-)
MDGIGVRMGHKISLAMIANASTATSVRMRMVYITLVRVIDAKGVTVDTVRQCITALAVRTRIAWTALIPNNALNVKRRLASTALSRDVTIIAMPI